MGAAEHIPRISFEDFLALERLNTSKHEWLDGIVYLMAGGTFEHGRLVDNVLVALRRHLAGRPCTPYSGNFLVRTPSGLGAYPDVMVFCGDIQGDAVDPQRAATNPTLIVEVLSDSTEDYDRGEKFENYKSLPSLETYVLVSQGEQQLEVYARKDAWQRRLAVPGDAVDLSSIGATLEVREILRVGAARTALPRAPGSAARPLRRRAPKRQRPQQEERNPAPMSDKTIVLERVYEATLEELWALWTTRQGFESWWGPVGFRVEVSAIDPSQGGELRYTMIADTPDMVAAMQQMDRPASHSVRATFSEVRPYERLVLTNVVDFVPGVAPYESDIDVDFFREHDGVRMRVTLHAMHDETMTDMQRRGFSSQLEKLDQRYARHSS